MPVSHPPAPTEPASRVDGDLHGQPMNSPSHDEKAIRAYVMDLWSIIPFYMGYLCAGLKQSGVDVTLGSARYHLDREYFQRMGLRPDPVLLDSGGGIQSSKLRRLVKCGEYIANLTSLALRFSVSRPDVLHVEYLPFLDRGFPFEVWFLDWVRRLGVPIVYTVHNVTFQNNAPGSHKALYSRAYGSADAVICHGEDARKELVRDLGISAEKIRVIPHGPLFAQKEKVSSESARAQLGLPAAEPLVLSLGVISEYKGVPFLLDAWKRLMDSGAKARLVIAGTGDAGLLSSIQAKVHQDKLESSVDLRFGYIPVHEIPLLHEAADILVYPYKACTTSGALLTGMNYERAIVATTLPYFEEHLMHDRTALLVDYADVDALAAALARLIASPAERTRLGQAVAQRDTTDTSWNDIGHATRECYQSLMHANSSRRS